MEKPHNEELYDLCCSPRIFFVIKSKKVRWSGYVTHITGFWWGNVKEETNLKRMRIWEDTIKMDTIEMG
jgi:hypothetical protein